MIPPDGFLVGTLVSHFLGERRQLRSRKKPARSADLACSGVGTDHPIKLGPEKGLWAGVEQNEALTTESGLRGLGVAEDQTQKYAPLCSINDYKLVEGRGLAFEVNADFLGELFKPAVISLVGRHVGGGFGFPVLGILEDLVEDGRVGVEGNVDLVEAFCVFVNVDFEDGKVALGG